MLSNNPIYRNNPTEAERVKMQNSGYSLNQVRGMQDQQTMNMRMGAGAPIAGNNVFGAQMQQNNAAFMNARAAGDTGAPMINKARQLAPLAAMENTAGMDPASANAMMMMPPAPADTGEGSMGPRGGDSPMPAPTPAQWDPFQNPDMKGMTGMEKRAARQARGFAVGGTIQGPGGPTDDMIPGVIDGTKGVRLSNREEIVDAQTRDWFGKKFFVDLKKKAAEAMGEMPKSGQNPTAPMMGMPGFSKGGTLDMMGPMPRYADGGTLDKISQAATRARIREQDAMLSPDPYGPTLNDSPVFQPIPRAAMMPAPSAASVPAFQPATAPAPMPMMRGQQPPMMLAAPMPEVTMRPAPRTMTEKEQMMMPARASRTPRANPAFEAAMTGMTGMEKRRMRSQLEMEEAAFARGQVRADAAARVADARAQQNREQGFTEWQQKQVIGDQFQQAAENRGIGTTAAMNAADDQQKQAAAAAAAEANRRFSPVLDAEGNPIPGRMMNPQGQQLNTEPTRADGIRMEPVPGMPGRVLPMMGGSRVPGLPMMQANTAPGPFRDGLGRTTFTPVQETEAAKAPTVRKTAPRKGFSADAPEWDYASLSDGSTRPITIDNPLPTQTKERFQHQYGRAPQTEQEWTEAWYLTTGQQMPAGSGKPAAAASASTAPATRAKIKSITPVS